MGINKSTQVTKVIEGGKELSFYLTKNLEPLCLYFVNDQKQIIENLKTFSIVPNKGDGENGAVTLTKLGTNVIATISVILIGKEVLIQFLIKSGLSLDKFDTLISGDKYQRFTPFFPVIKKAIELSGEVKTVVIEKARSSGKSEQLKKIGVTKSTITESFNKSFEGILKDKKK